ncbi:MAG: DUF86 domain-containing protein [Chloroflexi bacterium]|nr:DUF86 domain-containing protein [Chloroflexota bacterium]
MTLKSERIKTSQTRIVRDLAEWTASYRPIAALILFGSRARGEHTPLSDIDLAYLLEDGLTPEDRNKIDVDIYVNISRRVRSDNITLIDLAQAPPRFAFRVLSEGKVLALGNPERLASFKANLITQNPDAARPATTVTLHFEAGGKRDGMTVDIEKVEFQLRLIQEEMGYLKSATSLKEQDYISDGGAQRIVERAFQRAVDSCINIGNHLIARLHLEKPQDYGTIFTILGKARVISPGLAPKMVDLAHFRNLLVHLYWQIDHQKIFREMPEKVLALENFVHEITRLVRQGKTGSR